MITLEEILAIPGNSAVFKSLCGRLKEKSITAFAGAGASAPIYPLWKQLIENLAEEAIRLGVARPADKAYWVRNAEAKPLIIASQIRSKIQDPRWHPFLYEMFKDRQGPDGKVYTVTQAQIVKLPFKAILTTNYDPGLLEARREIRSDIRDTSFVVWNQAFAIQQWSSGDGTSTKSPLPILYAHGHFADPENIVLDCLSYQRAYAKTPYRRLFENMWLQEHLLFIGFGFNDATLNQIADDVLAQTIRAANSPSRHFIVIGLPVDHEYSEELRREYLERFSAEVLFYPVTYESEGHPNHDGLRIVLDALAEMAEVPAVSSGSDVIRERGKSAVEYCFIHETTEDEKFTGREAELARLDTWAKDPVVRLVAISAIGGLGKTSLTGHWLRSGRAASALNARAAFFWSFYRDNDSKNLLRALLRWGSDKLGWKQSQNKSDLVADAVSLLSSRSIAVVLDGLEVVQESPGTVAFGKVLQVELAEFLHDHCKSDSKSLVVLTSRFPFPDLTVYLGGALRPLPLPSLDKSSGAKLLWELGVRGAESDREEVCENLRGHPLGLRIFARSMPKDYAGDPTRLWQRIFDQQNLRTDDSLEAKLRRLLDFYEECLPDSHRRALSLVALFRMPVGESVLSPLWDALFRKTKSRQSLTRTLDELHSEHLLTSDFSHDRQARYTCHPILRDHFRAQILTNEGFARQAAGLLAEQPDFREGTSLDGIAILTTAIEALLEAGEIKAADDLYRARLANGKIFIRMLAPHLGLETVRHFVRDPARIKAVGAEVGVDRLGFFLDAAGVFARDAGEPETAYDFFGKAEELYRTNGNPARLAESRGKLADVQISLGNMRVVSHGATHVSDAIETKSRDSDVYRYAGFTALLQGDISYADSLFETAQKKSKRGYDVSGIGVFAPAEYRLRRGEADAAYSLLKTIRNRLIDSRSSDQVARCEAILGRAAFAMHDVPRASKHVQMAKKTFAAAHMIYDLASVLITEAKCLIAEKNWGEAANSLDRAIQLAAPRKYRLVQVDALNVRSQLQLESIPPNATGARDDAEAALQLAGFCDYAWGQRDACTSLAEALHKMGDKGGEAIRSDADQWNRRLLRTQMFG